MNKNTSAFSRKIAKFITSFTSIAIVSGVSVAVAAITFSNTSITGDSSFNNIVVGTSTASSNLLFIATTSPIFAVSSTGNVGIGIANPGTSLEVAGVVSSTQLRTPSSTISALTFTNASGTSLTASTYLQSAAGFITNVSSTRLDVTTGGTIANVSSTNISASGFGTFPTLNFTNASGTNLTASGYLQVASVSGDTTRATGATGSFQTIAGDLTYQGAAGGTSSYHAGVMGNFLGDTLTNANATVHAGTIGKYSVTTSDALVGPKAGLVGEAETSVANSAVMAVLGGDSGTVTPGAAYGVRYLNSTAASKFGFGLDLFSAAVGSYKAVDYGTADIRLSSGVRIYTGSAATRAAVRTQVGDTAPVGSLYVGSSSVATTKPNLYVKVLNGPGDTDWERVVTAASD